jgi:hypothetical protein
MYQGAGAGATLIQRPPETSSKQHYCMLLQFIHTSASIPRLPWKLYCNTVNPYMYRTVIAQLPSTLKTSDGTVELGSVGSVLWFETIDFPRVFLWSLSSVGFLTHPRESIDSWRWS